MRNATIIVVCLRGTATETIKNIVLAGIGKLIIIDGEDVTDADLGSGFFFRDEDVGKKVSMICPGIFFRSAHHVSWRQFTGFTSAWDV